MKSFFVLVVALAPFLARGAVDVIQDEDTTPLKVLCDAPGFVPQILVQFVEDAQAKAGVYVVQNGQFWPVNEITDVSYGLYGESMSKIGRLDNGGEVKLYMSVDGQELMGRLEGSDATFGDTATLVNCIDLELK